MRGSVWLVGAWLIGCSGEDAGSGDTDGTTPGGGTPNGGTPDCPVSGEALPDPFAALDGIEHACEEQPLYDPDVSTATSYFVGEFTIDDCGGVRGTETWVLFANPEWLENGGRDCQVVWDVSGTRIGAGAQFELSLSAAVDPQRTDCPVDMDDVPLYVGDTSFEITYDVTVSGDEATFTFPSGDFLGAGHANAGHVSYLSGMNCKLL